MRKSHAGLLTLDEIKQISKLEARYPVPKANFNRHFVNYQPIISLWKRLEMDPKIFSEDKILPVLWYFFKNRNRFITSVRKTADIDIFNKFYDFLSFVNYKEGTEVDLIIAHGTSNIERAKAAAEFYKKGVAPKVLFTGDKPFYVAEQEPEAEMFKEYALQNGVPAEAILTEPKSVTMVDNVKRSLILLEKNKIAHKSILFIVSQPFVRRTMGYWQKFTVGMKIQSFGVEPIDVIKRDTWYRSDDGAARIFAEISKLVIGKVNNIL